MKRAPYKTIWLSLPSKRYPIYCYTSSGWDQLASLPRQYPHSRLFLITDHVLARIYKNELKTLLATSRTAALDHQTNHPKNRPWSLITFPAGEHSKSHAVKLMLEEKLFKARCSRNDIIIALGGGVVGDLAGFVAATFMRGIKYISMPTTLVAMTDAAIGGKTGIDTPFGKNLIGAFHHPEAIYIHLPFLATLPHIEYLGGFAEIIKHALIRNVTLYKMLTTHIKSFEVSPLHNKRPMTATESVTASATGLFFKLLTESILIKVRVVIHDPLETAYRRILNFGHTIGHGIEILSDYKINHGNAVAIGCVFEAWLSYRLKYLPAEHFENIFSLIKNMHLPVTFPIAIKAPALYNACTRDKKNERKTASLTTTDTIKFVPLKKIGSVFAAKGTYLVSVEKAFFIKAFKDFQKWTDQHRH
ncbi:3-dehydroquinate synthase [Spirochaetota bacterium]|nr:3-dehydroquinate synthase [Spirochaetota bacterium]